MDARQCVGTVLMGMHMSTRPGMPLRRTEQGLGRDGSRDVDSWEGDDVDASETTERVHHPSWYQTAVSLLLVGAALLGDGGKK